MISPAGNKMKLYKQPRLARYRGRDFIVMHRSWFEEETGMFYEDKECSDKNMAEVYKKYWEARWRQIYYYHQTIIIFLTVILFLVGITGLIEYTATLRIVVHSSLFYVNFVAGVYSWKANLQKWLVICCYAAALLQIVVILFGIK